VASVAVLGAALALTGFMAAFLVPAAAQTGARARVVVFKTRDNAFYTPAADAFKAGLKARGYDAKDRVDLSVVALGGKGEDDARLVRDQLRKNPRLVVTLGTDATRLVAGEKPAMPVLFGMILDPVGLGLVRSHEAPGGAFTGTTLLVSPGKQIDALLQAAPKTRRIGVLYTDGDRTSLSLLSEARPEAKRLNVEIVAVPTAEGKHGQSLQQLAGQADALWLIPDPASTGPQALAETLRFAREQKLPVLGASGGTVRAGALLALSASLPDLGDVIAEMAVQILDGNASPAQMRVRGPRRTVLSLNLESARFLSIEVPDAVLQLADEVVDLPAEAK
jgi:putative ABC transport system substrate-binding protein